MYVDSVVIGHSLALSSPSGDSRFQEITERAPTLRLLEVLTSADAGSVVALRDLVVDGGTTLLDRDLDRLALGQDVQDRAGVRAEGLVVVAGHNGTPRISLGRLLGLIALEKGD